MKRTTLPLLGSLLLLGACMDRELPTALSPEGAAFSEVPAGTCVVTSTADDGGATTLRTLIGNSDCTTITFSLTLPATITLTSGPLIIAHDLTITGPGTDRLAVRRDPGDAAPHFRIFEITQTTTAEISGLTISGGSAAGETFDVYRGGGIYNYGTLTITNSTVSGNYAYVGGGIYSEGVLTITHSTVSGNSALIAGGIGNSGPLTLTNSTVSGNSASAGGGIVNGNEGTITNSTVSGNSAYDIGGGIGNAGTLTITHSTVTGNRANTGGGIHNVGGTATLRNTIIANSSSGGNCDVPITDDGYNLDSDGSCGFSAANHSLSDTDPLLGPLSLANGGPTATHALGEGSPAIDVIPVVNGSCNDTGVSSDQRGVGRPQGTACDIGAYELEVATPSQLLEALITLSMNTPGVSQGTNNKLLEARTHLNQGQIGPACNKLKEYIADVQNQRGKTISTTDADLLIARAQEIRSALGC